MYYAPLFIGFSVGATAQRIKLADTPSILDTVMCSKRHSTLG
jgi:hypothetical protein